MNPHRGLLHHLNLNVSDVARSSPFYGPMLSYFGYELVDSKHDGDYCYEDWTHWAAETPHMISLCQADKSLPFDRLARRAVGRFNHLAFCASDRADVDRFHAEVLVPLARQGLTMIEDAPCACPEYGEDYYATFFFDPDGIKYEFVATTNYSKRKAARGMQKGRA